MKVVIVLLVCVLSVAVSAEHPSSFSKAKKILAKEIYTDNQVTFYCSCDYSLQPKPNKPNKKRLTPDWESCGFEPRKNANRAGRVEWEHVMPAHHFGQHLACWRQGGRKGCRKDPVFKKMESDMHNLVPAVGEINGDRSNFKYGMIEGEARVYGSCDAEVNFKAKRFEPTEQVRGDIARIYLYMSDQYKVRLSKQQRRLMEAWSKSDPVSEWERERNKRISSIQGNSNPYIE